MSLTFYLGKYVDLGGESPEWFMVFDTNMTHNLTPMWRKAGIYDALYNAEGKLAQEIISILKVGLDDMEEYSDEYKKLSPSNGWGTYEGAIEFLSGIINACESYPKAEIFISK